MHPEQTQQETEQQQQTGDDLNSLSENQDQGEQQQIAAEEQGADEPELAEHNQNITQEEPQQCQEG